MFYPSIFTDEIHEGYYGRLINFNAFSENKQKLLSFVKRRFPQEKFSSTAVTFAEILAYSSNITLEDFIINNTLLPYRFAIVANKNLLEGRYANDIGTVRSFTRQMLRPGAYFCVACIQKDLKCTGISYWRRSHQLPGTYICEEHCQALKYMESEDAFLRPPSTYIKSCQVIDSQWARDCHSNVAVSNFLKISVKFLNSKNSIDLEKIRPFLIRKAKVKKLSPSGQEGMKLLSDRVVANFPSKWLETVFSGLSQKSAGQAVEEIDDIPYRSNISSSVSTYILAICVLFDSEKEFFNSIQCASIMCETSDQNIICKFPAQQQIDFNSEYIRTMGNYSKIARENCINLKIVTYELAKQGLPNLTLNGDRKGCLIKAAMNFLIGGHTLEESAKNAAVKLKDLERVIKYSSAELITTLLKMHIGNKNFNRPKKYLFPHHVN